MWCCQNNSAASCQPEGPTELLQVWWAAAGEDQSTAQVALCRRCRNELKCESARRWDCWVWKSDWESIWAYTNRWSHSAAYLVRKHHCKLQERDGHPWTPLLMGLSFTWVLWKWICAFCYGGRWGTTHYCLVTVAFSSLNGIYSCIFVGVTLTGVLVVCRRWQWCRLWGQWRGTCQKEIWWTRYEGRGILCC